MSPKSRTAILTLTAALVALSLWAATNASARSARTQHNLGFTVVKRTSHYDVVKGHSLRFAVPRGARSVVVPGVGRCKVVRRTPRQVVLRGAWNRGSCTPVITSPNSGTFAAGTQVPITWKLSSSVSDGGFLVSLEDPVAKDSAVLTESRIEARRGAKSYSISWSVSQPSGSYRLWVQYYDSSGRAAAADCSDGVLEVNAASAPVPDPTPTPPPAPTPTAAPTTTPEPVPTVTPSASPAPAPTLSPTPTPTVSPKTRTTCQYGVHMDLTYDGHEWRRAKAIQAVRDVLHASISRNSLLWHQVESVEGVRDWSRTDAVVAELTAAGIEPLFVIYGSPAWANGIHETTSEYYHYVPTDAGAFDTWLARYVSFATEAVMRYQGRVRKWEIGNEQNEHFFWKPKPNPSQYARFYTALFNAIRSVDPHAEVAMGGLAGLLFSGSDDITGLDFLKAMNARGIFPEAIAIHPYCIRNQPPNEHIEWEGNFDDIQAVYDYVQTLARPASIWVTEWGWPVGAVTEQQQADYMLASLRMIDSQYTYVTVATAFLDYDRPSYSYGLFDADFNPRPAAFAFGSFASDVQ